MFKRQKIEHNTHSFPSLIQSNHFHIITWNVWFDELRQTDRAVALLAACVAESQADVLCFQEVTTVFYRIIQASDYIHQRYVCVEALRTTRYDVSIWVRRDFTVLSHWDIQIPSEQHRRCLVVDIDITSRVPEDLRSTVSSPCRVRVATVHLESLRHNAACRATQLETILSALVFSEDAAACTDIFLTGDFNFCSSWTENEIIDTHPCVTDLWAVLRPGEQGYTEDSAVNTMLRMRQGKNKQVRFDRILQLRPAALTVCSSGEGRTSPPVTPPRRNQQQLPFPPSPLPRREGACICHPVSIQLTGTRPTVDEAEEIFPSDHFGVVATFEIRGVRRVSTDNSNGGHEITPVQTI